MGVHYLVAHTAQYIVLEDPNGTVALKFYRYDSVTGMYVPGSIDIQDLLSVYVKTQNMYYYPEVNNLTTLAPNCVRVKYGDLFFFLNPSGVLHPIPTPVNFTTYAVDDTLAYAIGTDGQIYFYDNSSTAYVVVFTPTPLLSANSSIQIYRNRMIINSTEIRAVPVTTASNYTYNTTQNVTFVYAFLI